MIPFEDANWRKHCVLRRPPETKPVFDEADPNSNFLRPLLNWQSYTVTGYQFGIPPVSHLLSLSGPPTVIWAVVFIVVNAVKRVLRSWRAPHVGEKQTEFFPSITHGDTSTSVMGKVLVVWVVATLVHMRPSSVLFRPNTSTPTSRLPVLGCPRIPNPRASTRFRLPGHQGVCDSRERLTAFADAAPCRKSSASAASFVISSTDNLNTIEYLTCQVNEFSHFVTSKLLTVKGAWQSAVRPFFGSYPSHAH